MKMDRETAKMVAKLKTLISKLEEERNVWRSASLEYCVRIKDLEKEVGWFKGLLMGFVTNRK